MASGLFDPAHYRDVRRPLAEASHLPPWCYTSQAVFDREVERIFSKTWNLVGRAELIPSAGDYIAIDLVGVPLIIVRGQDGAVRAFANTCRHRGARLLQGAGKCKAISCPYHSWTYALDGRLIGAPGMKGVQGFDLAEHGLLPVRLETWDGFLFANLSRDTESLASHLGELPDKLRCYDFANMVCTRRKSYDVGANWKLITENSMEDYHTATVHRKSIGVQKITIEQGAGKWEAGHFESESTIGVLPGESKAFPRIPTLTGKAATGTYFVLIYPSTTFACNQDGMFWLELYPRGPARTELIVGHCFPRETVQRDDFEEVAARYYHRCDVSIPEDNNIAEVQQAGLSSPFARPGRVSPHEAIVHSLGNWILNHVLEEEPAAEGCRAAGG